MAPTHEQLNYRDLKNSLPIDLKLRDEKCETCCLAKTIKTPVSKQSENKASRAGERIFTDVVGPITPATVDGFRYFVTFIDDYSSHACVNFMRHKNQALQKLKRILLKMVLLAYYGLTKALSIQTKVLNSFIPTRKSSEKTLFLKLRNRMVSQSDTTEQLLKLLEVL